MYVYFFLFWSINDLHNSFRFHICIGLQYVEESYDIPRSHQLPYTKIRDSNNGNSEYNNTDGITSELRSSGTCSSMLELSDDRSSIKKASNSAEAEFSSSTIPKRRHFYTNAAPAKIEGTFFRYDFEDKVL